MMVRPNIAWVALYSHSVVRGQLNIVVYFCTLYLSVLYQGYIKLLGLVQGLSARQREDKRHTARQTKKET